MKVLALDTETTGIYLHHGCKPFMASICRQDSYIEMWEWPVDPFTRQPKIPLDELSSLADNLSDATIIFHNAKFDLRALASIGISIYFKELNWSNTESPKYKVSARVEASNFHDTQIASHVCDSMESHRLKDLAEKYIGILKLDEEELSKKTIWARRVAKSEGWSMGVKHNGNAAIEFDYWMPKAVNEFSPECGKYCVNDSARTLALWEMYSEVLKSERLENSYHRELDLVRVVYDMETDGVTIHIPTVHKELDRFKSLTSPEELKCQKIAGIFKEWKAPNSPLNVRSPTQLKKILYDTNKFDLPVLAETNKGYPSTDEDTLRLLLDYGCRLSKAFINHLLNYRAYIAGVRYLTNYTQASVPYVSPSSACVSSRKKYRNISVMYPSFHQTGTRTTRFSSSDPNAQNVSKKARIPLRNVFVPPPGKVWISFDYSQIELRLFAYISREQSLIDAFEAGYDFHAFVAQNIYNKPLEEITKEERRVAKNTNFSIIFGGSPRKVNATAGIPDAYSLFAGQFPNVSSFLSLTINEVRKNGYVTTLDGYRLMVSRKDPYKGVSYKIQGTAGSIIKNAMRRIWSSGIMQECNARLVMQIHDELIIEMPVPCSLDPLPKSFTFVAKTIKDMMEIEGTVLGVNTPSSAELITTNWASGIKLELA